MTTERSNDYDEAMAWIDTMFDVSLSAQDDAKTIFGFMMREVLQVNGTNGWYDSDRSFGDEVALLHSEVTEMFEAYREDGPDDKVKYTQSGDGYEIVFRDSARDRELRDAGLIGKPLGVASEAADQLIRLLDFCARYEIDIVAEYRGKLAFNRTRGYKHGGKKL